MSLDLDPRQRAMLAEMGLQVFEPLPLSAPQPQATPVPPPRARAPAAAPVAAPVPVADRADPAPAAAPPTQAPEALDALDWDALAGAATACRACGLCQGRRQAVFGLGDRQATWLIVGEAPSEQEDLQGEPFAGPPGQLLDNMLRALGLDRAQGAYLTHAIKCRPPGNRNPEADEIARCGAYLQRQVALLRPQVILAMGRLAAQALLGSTEPMGRLRGQVHRYRGVPVVVTYHPAYLLRNLPDKAKAWADLCLAQQVVDEA